MPGKRVANALPLIIAAAVSVSVASFGVYINTAPIVSVTCVKCEGSDSSCASLCTEDFSVWSSVQQHNWELLAIYLTLGLAGLYAVALIVERSLVLYSAGRQSREFQSKAGEALFRGQATRAVCLTRDYPDSPLAFVINETFATQGDENELRPSMRLRHLAIVARTIELNQGLWHLSAIGWSMGLLAVLALCIGAINSGRLIRYTGGTGAEYLLLALTDSFSVVVYCVLAGFVILGAYKFFTARVKHFQLEMDRLSLAFIEGVTNTSDAPSDYRDSIAAGFSCNESRVTSRLRAARVFR